MLINLEIISFSNKIFANKVKSISCYTADYGMIEVLYNHENAEYCLSQGVILISLENGDVKKFYSGVGYIKISNNNIEICAFPVMSQINEDMLNKLGDYGEYCLNAWAE